MTVASSANTANDAEIAAIRPKYKVLVIDDEVGISKVICRVAEQLGMESRSVNNSQTATGTFVEFRPDVVILDLIMPDMDGIDVLNEILITGISSRIVVMSGYGEAYVRLAIGVARFHAAGEISVLRKPFRRLELINMLTMLTVGPGQDPLPPERAARSGEPIREPC